MYTCEGDLLTIWAYKVAEIEIEFLNGDLNVCRLYAESWVVAIMCFHESFSIG